MFEALTSIPNASVSMGVRYTSVLPDERLPMPVSPSWHRIHFRAELVITGKTIQSDTGKIADLPFLRGISVYTSRKRRAGSLY